MSGAGAKELQTRLDAATASLNKLFSTKGTPLLSEIIKLRREIGGLEKDPQAAGNIAQLLGQFDASTAMNIQPRAIKDYISDFQLLNNLAGSLNEEMGTRFGDSRKRSRSKVKGLYDAFHHIVTTGEAPEEISDLTAFAGVHAFPARIKCATLGWHAVLNALRGDAVPATTETRAD